MTGRARTFRFGASQRGFSLIEVMIAVLVLGVGLLAFAMLQTMSVRFAQSANKRTQAANVSYDLLDQMRVNRIAAANYAGDYAASQTGCNAAPSTTVGAASYRTLWQCRLFSALGPDASARVTYAGGVATVAVSWGDERWNDADKDGTVTDAEASKTFTVSSRL